MYISSSYPSLIYDLGLLLVKTLGLNFCTLLLSSWTVPIHPSDYSFISNRAALSQLCHTLDREGEVHHIFCHVPKPHNHFPSFTAPLISDTGMTPR